VLELGALPGAVPSARLHARNVLHEWDMAQLANTAELLVSELVTNAVYAANAAEGLMPVRLLLVAGVRSVQIQVWDANPSMPVRLEPTTADAEHGRGLILVEALSSTCGAYRCAGIGKVVWAVAEA
jgi:anti-sigma regulatory factor (Ser/Thr protein kinase)